MTNNIRPNKRNPIENIKYKVVTDILSVFKAILASFLDVFNHFKA